MYQDDFAVLRIRVSIVGERDQPLPRQAPLILKQLKQFCARIEVRQKLSGASMLQASCPTNARLPPALLTDERPRP